MPQFTVEQFRTEAAKPFYAAAGAAELAVDFARGYATEAQKSYQERVGAVQSRVEKLPRIDYRDPRALQSQARELVTSRLEELGRDARDAQARFEARVADLQQDARAFPERVQAQVFEAVEELTATYADLAARGEKFVAALRKDGVRAVATVRKAPAKSTVARRERAVSAAKKSATGATRKSTAKKAPAKKSTTKSSTAKKTPAKKATTPTTPASA